MLPQRNQYGWKDTTLSVTNSRGPTLCVSGLVVHHWKNLGRLLHKQWGALNFSHWRFEVGQVIFQLRLARYHGCLFHAGAAVSGAGAVTGSRPAYNKDRCFTLLVIDDQNTDWWVLTDCKFNNSARLSGNQIDVVWFLFF